MPDKEILDWLHWALCSLIDVKVEYTLVKPCYCGSCYVYRISWEEDDNPIVFEKDSLREAVEAASKIRSVEW